MDWGGEVAGLYEETTNYVSMNDYKDEAEIELNRLEGFGYLKKMKKEEVAKAGFPNGAPSRTATKRRIVIDLRRSGAISKSRWTERLILPKPQDAIDMTLQLFQQWTPQSRDQEAMELVLVDVSDAFPHLAAQSRSSDIVPPSLDQDHDHMLLFTAMLFGFKTAPLVWPSLCAIHISKLKLTLQMGAL